MVRYNEKRKEVRHALKTGATIQVVRNGEALSGTTCDVSSRGLLLILDQHADLRVGEEVVCEVNIPGDSGRPQAEWGRGKLVRVNETQAAILLTKGTLDHTLCYDVLTEARRIASERDSESVTLSVHPEIANALKGQQAGLVEEFESLTKKKVIIEVDAAASWGHYEIR